MPFSKFLFKYILPWDHFNLLAISDIVQSFTSISFLNSANSSDSSCGLVGGREAGFGLFLFLVFEYLILGVFFLNYSYLGGILGTALFCIRGDFC